MPSFLAKKYQASRSVSGTGTPGSSYNNLGCQTPNNSFNSRSSEEVVTDVQVVPNPEASVSMPTYQEEPVAHHRPYHRRGYDDDAFGEPQQPQQQQYRHHQYHHQYHRHNNHYPCDVFL
eukprot:TRINITY_DN21393_c0_g1_i1.p1 TRINITY_DN21393_c0_g1~~TRINITY_DN21393_c0_g1_i1.p1  ORF type:complete len:119 (-),score=41.16 TRINITY_DN21393_c0_g1_i1:122-478(-)